MVEISSYAHTPELWNKLKMVLALEFIQNLNFKLGILKPRTSSLCKSIVSYASLTERQFEGNSDIVLFFNQLQYRSSVLIAKLFLIGENISRKVRISVTPVMGNVSIS